MFIRFYFFVLRTCSIESSNISSFYWVPIFFVCPSLWFGISCKSQRNRNIDHKINEFRINESSFIAAPEIWIAVRSFSTVKSIDKQVAWSDSLYLTSERMNVVAVEYFVRKMIKSCSFIMSFNIYSWSNSCIHFGYIIVINV